MVAQELPALSAPQPSPSPSHTECDEPISVDENDYVAPRDINLDLDECNILPGNSKRQRTRSSHAADADSVAAVRPAKRGQHWSAGRVRPDLDPTRPSHGSDDLVCGRYEQAHRHYQLRFFPHHAHRNSPMQAARTLVPSSLRAHIRLKSN
ncbi:hypothetical protein B0H14DRAFT_2587857 [Mycena olivaceomarginata]|nr:hypothetical protein B0H14DRAFT_2587857 [Mycena olivaceomarginata]